MKFTTVSPQTRIAFETKMAEVLEICRQKSGKDIPSIPLKFSRGKGRFELHSEESRGSRCYPPRLTDLFRDRYRRDEIVHGASAFPYMTYTDPPGTLFSGKIRTGFPLYPWRHGRTGQGARL